MQEQEWGGAGRCGLGRSRRRELGWRWRLRRGLVSRWGGRREAVVVIGVEGGDDGVVPLGVAAGADEFVLGEMEGLEHGLCEVREGACGAGLYVAASDGDEDAAEGGVEVVGGEVVAGEEEGEIRRR